MKKILLSIILLISFSSLLYPCTNLIVTKGASADGSIMVTYAADSYTRYGTLVHYPAARYDNGTMREIRQWGQDKYLGEIPEAACTYNVIGNMNEHQLIIGETTWGGRPECKDPDGIVDYGSLEYICLQRCTTAREAIKLFAELADKYGYASTGETLTFADKNEIWIMEVISRKPDVVNGRNRNKGIVWVAVRVPDGYISAHANCARITTFPLNDPENCMYARDVISHARKIGIYKGSDKDFSFADTYCPLKFSLMRACEGRVWSFFNRYADLDMSAYIDYASGHNPANRMPLYVKPNQKISMQMLADMMRDHYESTPFDMTQDVGAGGNETPYRWKNADWTVDGEEYCNERPICTQQTGFWFVAQARSWLPDEIGGLFWFAVDDAGTSALTPVYSSSTKVSWHYALGNGSMVEYSESSMFWLNNRIAQFAYTRYNPIGLEVQKHIRAHEQEMVRKVAECDRRALEILKENENIPEEFGKPATEITDPVIAYLTDFSVRQADLLFEKWSALDKYLLVKYMDGTVKKQLPADTDKTEHSCETENDVNFNANDAAAVAASKGLEVTQFVKNGSVNYIPVSPDWPGYSEKFKRAIVNDTGNHLKKTR